MKERNGDGGPPSLCLCAYVCVFPHPTPLFLPFVAVVGCIVSACNCSESQPKQPVCHNANPDLAVGVAAPNPEDNVQHFDDNNPDEDEEKVVVGKADVIEVEKMDAGNEGGVGSQEEAWRRSER